MINRIQSLKGSIAFLALLLSFQLVQAQNTGINSTGAAPDSSALLDVSSNNQGMLIPRMDSLQIVNIANPAKGLMVYDSVVHLFKQFNGSQWEVLGIPDDMGNHQATQNIELGNYGISNNGNATGIRLDAQGQVGIGIDPQYGPFRAKMSESTQPHIEQLQINTIQNPIFWQSFTPTISGLLTHIKLVEGPGTVDYQLYEGEGIGGTLLASGTQNIATTQIIQYSIPFDSIPLQANQKYTFNISNSDAGITFISNSNPYPDGISSYGPGIDASFTVYMVQPDPGFWFSNTGFYFNNYGLPEKKGLNNQVLTSTGFQSAFWANQPDLDAQDLNFNGTHLTLTHAAPLDLSTFLDNTDAQGLSLLNDTLYLSNDPTPVDLSYLNKDQQDLSLNGNILSLSNDPTTVDLSAIPITDQQDLSLSGNTLSLTNTSTTVDLSGYLDADNLGNHIADQNLALNGHWLSHDGSDTGIQIDTAGRVGIGLIPEAPFHVFMNKRVQEQPQVNFGFDQHTSAFWQSFTTDYAGDLDAVQLPEMFFSGTLTYELYEGEGTIGTLLHSGSTTSNTLAFPGIKVAQGVQYTFNITGATFFNFVRIGFADYPGGRTNIVSPFSPIQFPDVWFSLFYTINDTGFRADATGVTFNKYTFPLTDGNAGQILTQGLSNSLEWQNQIDLDQQDLNLLADTLSISNGSNKIPMQVYYDNTDEQDLSISGNILSLTNDATTVDLSSYVNTDQQDLNLIANNLTLTNDASPVDLSPFKQDLSIANDSLFLSNDLTTVDLSSFRQQLSLANNSLALSEDMSPIDLSNYQQDLTKSGHHLNLSYGTSIDLSSYVNTDNQELSISGTVISLTNDPTPVDLSTVTFPDQQQLTLSGNILSLTGDASPVDLSVFLTADDLGNHEVSQNLEMNGHWVSADGQGEGIYIDTSGAVGFNMVPDADAIFQAKINFDPIGFKITETGVGVRRTAVTNVLEVEGNASKSTPGDWLANSDARLKKNIIALNTEKTLEQLLSLQGVSYEWDDDKTGSIRPTEIQYGFTAQNIQEVFPTLVKEDNLGYLQTSYGDYDAMIIESFRALNEMIVVLEKENNYIVKTIDKNNEQLKDIPVLETQVAKMELLREKIDQMELLLLKTTAEQTSEHSISEK